jgi:hypothetical protein
MKAVGNRLCEDPAGYRCRDIVQNCCLAITLETDSEYIPHRLAVGLASEYKKTIPYVKIPCGLCRRVLHFHEV